MKRVTTSVRTIRVESYNLSDDLHDMVSYMINHEEDAFGNYSLRDVDADMLDSWIDNAKAEGDKDYEEFLSQAQLGDADVFTLEDWLGDYSQTIGEVAVYYSYS